MVKFAFNNMNTLYKTVNKYECVICCCKVTIVYSTNTSGLQRKNIEGKKRLMIQTILDGAILTIAISSLK